MLSHSSTRAAAAAAAATLLLTAAAAAAALLHHRKRRGINPFSQLPPPTSTPPSPNVDKTDAILRRSFAAERVPSDLDAIVIGSGIGGLSVAALLSLAGKRVLVLEQHDVAGGCCHTFSDKGYEFDIGIHYVGEMHRGSPMRVLADQITRGKLQWAPMHNECYDVVAMGDGRRVEINADRQQCVLDLCRDYPKYAKQIRQFFLIAEEIRKGDDLYWALKLMPLSVARLLLRTRILSWLSPTVRLADVGFVQFVRQMGIDCDELITVLGYCFGDFGCPLSQAPFIMQVALLNHFQSSGAYYPVGGASSISLHTIPTITAAGGDVLVRAKVTAILSSAQGKANGVRILGPAGKVTDLHAPLIISDAGMRNTANLLPAPLLQHSRIMSILQRVPAGISTISVFVGLRAAGGRRQIEQLQLKQQNIWSFSQADAATACDNYLSLSAEEAVATHIPLLFTSFPSLKDPNWNERMGDDKLTCAIVTLAPWEWFSQWKDDRVKHRDRHYRDLKAAFGKRMWNQVLELVPQLEQLDVEVFEVGTPVSNQFYIGSSAGEVYGLDHGLNRSDPLTCAAMRPDMGVPGLLLTGQDVAMCGFTGALVGGLFCASHVLNRMLIFDLEEMVKKVEK